MISLTPAFSRIEFCLRMGFRLSALAALAIAELPLGLLFLLGAPIVLSLPALYPATIVANPRRIHGISLGPQHCLVSLGNSELSCAPPLVKYCSEFLLLLEFKTIDHSGRRGRRRLRLVLFADSLPADDNRRLRRYLKFERQPVIS